MFLCPWLIAKIYRFSEIFRTSMPFSSCWEWTRRGYLWAFSVGQERHTLQRSNICIWVAFRIPNIGKKTFFGFFTEFDRKPLQWWLSQNLRIGLCQIRVVQKWTQFENYCHLCPKWGLNLATRSLFASISQYSLQNPKNFRTSEPFKFSNVRFFYPY